MPWPLMNSKELRGIYEDMYTILEQSLAGDVARTVGKYHFET